RPGRPAAHGPGHRRRGRRLAPLALRPLRRPRVALRRRRPAPHRAPARPAPAARHRGPVHRAPRPLPRPPRAAPRAGRGRAPRRPAAGAVLAHHPAGHGQRPQGPARRAGRLLRARAGGRRGPGHRRRPRRPAAPARRPRHRHRGGRLGRPPHPPGAQPGRGPSPAPGHDRRPDLELGTAGHRRHDPRPHRRRRRRRADHHRPHRPAAPAPGLTAGTETAADSRRERPLTTAAIDRTRQLDLGALRRRVGFLAPLVALVLVQQVLYPAPKGIVLNGALVGGRIALIALGIALVYRANRIVNFAQGDLAALPAVLGVMLVVAWGWSYWLGLLAGLVAAVVLGVLVEGLIIRRFFTAPRLVLTVATIGLAQVLAGGGLLLPRAWGDTSFGTRLP